MPGLVRSAVLFLFVGVPVLWAESKTASIDRSCLDLQSTLSTTVPFVFEGPDPWVELDTVPAYMPGNSIAYAYTTGIDIRWVYLRLMDEDDGWLEDVSYFYRPDGSLMKRVRNVSSVRANIALEVISYYENGRQIRRRSHHKALAKGHQDSSAFDDPEAPDFLTTDDLPFLDITDLWRHLA